MGEGNYCKFYKFMVRNTLGNWVNEIEDKIKPYGVRKWSELIQNSIREQLRDIEHPTVVEVGCGKQCWLINQIRPQFPTMHIVGVDIDEASAQNPHIDKFYCAPATSIPLADQTVDVVICWWVFEHLSDPDKSLSEIHRILKPGGHLYFCTPNKRNPAMQLSYYFSLKSHHRIVRLLTNDREWDNCATYYKMNTIGELKNLAASHGLCIHTLRLYSGLYRYFRSRKYAYIIACWIGRMSNLWPWSSFRQVIVGDFMK